MRRIRPAAAPAPASVRKSAWITLALLAGVVLPAAFYRISVRVSGVESGICCEWTESSVAPSEAVVIPPHAAPPEPLFSFPEPERPLRPEVNGTLLPDDIPAPIPEATTAALPEFPVPESLAAAAPQPSEPPHRKTPAATAPQSGNQGSFTPAAYRLNPTPSYPPGLKAARIEGSVKVRILIDADGIPTAVEILNSSGHTEFDTAARNIILRQWRFIPACRNGLPVETSVTTGIEFVLDKNRRK